MHRDSGPHDGGRVASPVGTVTGFSTGITFGSTVQMIALGPDGNLWFSENNTSKIGRITPTGTVTEFPLSPNTGPLWIAPGPDGNVWFTEYDSTRNIAHHRGRAGPAGRPAAIGRDPFGPVLVTLADRGRSRFGPGGHGDGDRGQRIQLRHRRAVR